jgi:UDP:flavonoid glycosyltransferase YjiC (YdhE family)
MSRILLTWELGSNLGHLSRLLPLARRLKAHGHGVLVVARDLALAAPILGPAGIPFIQAPHATRVPVLKGQPASYADLLRYHGWAETSQLWGLTQAWVNLMRLFLPSVVIADHSPTALLATRVTQTPGVIIGTGFEVPPFRQPLPPFPGFRGATEENALQAESKVLETANRVLEAQRGQRLSALSDLFESERRWLTTFAELDHYGARPTERYVGPFGEVSQGGRVTWPSGYKHRVFAYLRPNTPHLAVILRALAAGDAAVVCYGPGIDPKLIGPLRSPRFIVPSRPVELRSLLPEASLCVSYSPAATVASALLSGVPQLLSPANVEAQLTAHRVEGLGAGLTLRGAHTEATVTAALQRLLGGFAFKARAAAFADRYRGFDPGEVADVLVDEIESLASQGPVSQTAA